MQQIPRSSRLVDEAAAHGALRTWALVAGLVLATAGLCVTIGWLLGIESLKRIAPNLVTLKFNTAICLVLLGIGIAAGAHTRFARVASVFVTAIAVVSLAEYVTGRNLGIDEAFFRDVAGGTSYPGRMAVTTALCLCLAATGVYALRHGRRRLVTGAALSMLTVGWLGCLGYLFGVRALYDVGPLSTMSAQTAVAIVILAVGLLASSPNGPLPWIVRGEDPGATVLRSILPLAFVGLPVVAELTLAGQHLGWYGTGFGLAIMVVVASFGVVAIAVHGARVINRSHGARVVANEQLRDLNASLEAKIEERTAELATTEAWARALAGSAPIGIFRTDVTGGLTYFNDRWCEIFGLSEAEGMRDGWTRGAHPDDREWMLREWARATAAGGEFDAEFRVVRPAGEVLWVHAHGAQILGVDDANRGYVGTVEDVTSRRETEVALRDAEELFRTSFESSPVGIALVDEGGRIVRANLALSELTGYSPDELTARQAESLIHPGDIDKEQPRVGSAGGDQRIVRADRSVRWASIHYAPIGHHGTKNPALTVAQFVDTTERHHFEERLAYMADHDPLTGLMNRRSFELALTAHVALCKRYGPAGAVLMLDLDHFKRINDTYGHNVGDEVIVTTARRLRQRLRESDLIARLGGDEFVVLLPVGGGAEARIVAQMLVEEIRVNAAAITGDTIGLSASVGVAAFDDVHRSAGEMLVNADLAMYDAKELGRDGWAEFGTDEHREPR